MRILDLQRRLREAGRIRIGEQVATGNGKTRPSKLTTFRLTSRDQLVITAASKIFGGRPETWESPDGEQWQVKTDRDDLQVVVPPGEMSFSQAYEQWTAGGCRVRCDGQFDSIADAPCHCDPTNRECSIHTRLSVILPDLPGLGVWRLDTQGYYAAVELGGVVDLAAAFAARGQMIPARLRLEQRSVKRFDAEGKSKTLRFAVPILDLDVQPLALAQAQANGGALPAGAVGGATFSPVPLAELPAAPVASIAEQIEQIEAGAKKRRGGQVPLPATGLQPRTAAEAEAGGDAERVPVATLAQLVPAGPQRNQALLAARGVAQKLGLPVPGSFEAIDDERVVAGVLEKLGIEAPQSPSASAEPPPQEAGAGADPRGSSFSAKDVGAAATRAFPLADAPRGTKTKMRERLRYAMAYAVTSGRAWHTGDLTVQETGQLISHLHQIETKEMTWHADDDGVVFTRGSNEVDVPWSVLEPAAVSDAG